MAAKRTRTEETAAATAAVETIAAAEAEETGAAPGEGGQERADAEARTVPSVAEGNGKVTLVYIGPSLPFGKLRSSMILKGTGEEIGAYLGELKESYPEIERLLVAPEDLTDALDKVGRKGTILHKYYEDVLAKSRASRKG